MHAHLAPQLVQFVAAQLVHDVAVDFDVTALGHELAADQAHQRRLSAAARAHDADDFAARDREVDAFQQRRSAYAKRRSFISTIDSAGMTWRAFFCCECTTHIR